MPLRGDIVDSRSSDWWISDDGIDRGPIDTWPAPVLGLDNRNNAYPITHVRRASMPRDRFDFLRYSYTFRSPHVRGADAKGFNDADAGAIGQNVLRPNEALSPGQQIISKNRQFRLTLQKDGNLALYNAQNAALWDAGTTGRGLKAIMQGDGNFVVYGAGNQPLWQSGTGPGHNGAFLQLQDDANLVVYQGSNVLWNSGTWGGVHAGAHDSKSFLSSIGSAVSSVGSSIGGAVGGVVSGIARPIGGLVTSPIHLVSDIAHGRNVFESLKADVKSNLSSVGQLAPYVQTVVSFVPGVGAGINAAIAAGSALAHGQPITDALVAGVKGMIPGGPIAQQALQTAYNVAKGQNLTAAAAGALRSQLPPGPAQSAFDVGISLAHGANLQQAAISGAQSALSGAAQTALSGATDLVRSQGMDAIRNLSPLATGVFSSVGPRLQALGATAVSLVPQQVGTAAKALLENPSLRGISASELANRMNITPADARNAIASVVQAVSKSGGAGVPSLAPAGEMAQRLGMSASFDDAMMQFASRASAPVYGANATRRLPVAGRRNPFNFIWHNQGGTFRPVLFPSARAAQMGMGAQGFVDAGADAGANTIRQGSSGPDVVAWQNIIGVTADGKFGPQTAAATKAWQSAHGLTADGVVGPLTWAAASSSATPSAAPGAPSGGGSGTVTLPEITITPGPNFNPVMPRTIQSGATGPDVVQWQNILIRDGFATFAADGNFGPATDAATRAWQGAHGITPDGVVGPQTWNVGLSPIPAPSVPAGPGPVSSPAAPPIVIAPPTPAAPPVVVAPPAPTPVSTPTPSPSRPTPSPVAQASMFGAMSSTTMLVIGGIAVAALAMGKGGGGRRSSGRRRR